MADAKISDLPAADPLDGTEQFPVVQSGETRRATVPSGAIVQKLSQAFTGSHEETTETSFQNTSVVMPVTPQHDDSILIVGVSFYAVVFRDSGSPSNRWGRWQIRNETDDVGIDGAADVAIGRVLVSGSSSSATTLDAVTLVGRYQVDSVAKRTFRLRFHSSGAEMLTRLALGNSAAHMFIEEIRP